MTGTTTRRQALKIAMAAPALAVGNIATAVDAAAKPGVGVSPNGAARLFIILDDASIGQRSALVEAEKRGQLLNLAVCTDSVTNRGGVDHLSWPDIRRAAARGHGIIAHSKTHRWLTNASDAEMAEEFDYSQTMLATATGVKVRDFAYPSSKHDLRTDSAAASRYRRVFAGRWGGDQWRHSFCSRKPFVCGRYGWSSSNHAAVVGQIKAAAAAQEDIVIATHATDGSNWQTEGVKGSEFTAILDLALKLRVRVAHIDDFDLPSAPLADPPLLCV